MIVDLKVLISSMYDDDSDYIKNLFDERLSMYFCMNVYLFFE